MVSHAPLVTVVLSVSVSFSFVFIVSFFCFRFNACGTKDMTYYRLDPPLTIFSETFYLLWKKISSQKGHKMYNALFHPHRHTSGCFPLQHLLKSVRFFLTSPSCLGFTAFLRLRCRIQQAAVLISRVVLYTACITPKRLVWIYFLVAACLTYITTQLAWIITPADGS